MVGRTSLNTWSEQGAGRYVQSNQSSLKVLLQEDALLRLGPIDILFRHFNLDFAAVGDGNEEVEKCADYGVGRWRSASLQFQGGKGRNALSFAVLAFARCSINVLDDLTTFARAVASLSEAARGQLPAHDTSPTSLQGPVREQGHTSYLCRYLPT